MNRNRRPTTKFDLRPVDFDSGKRMALPNSEKINCDCCGKKIAMGYNTLDGHKIGSECANMADYLRYSDQISASNIYGISKKQAEFYGVSYD